MIKTLAFAVLIAVASLAASAGVGYWRLQKLAEPAAEGHKEQTEQKKTRIINVPMIVSGQVQGYIVAQFAYVVDSHAAKELGPIADNFILDEAFRMIYADETLDFRQLKKFDLTKLSQEVLARVRQRMKSEAVKEILVHEFNFVPREYVRQ